MISLIILIFSCRMLHMYVMSLSSQFYCLRFIVSLHQLLHFKCSFCEYISVDLQSWHCPSLVNIFQYFSFTFCFIMNRSFARFLYVIPSCTCELVAHIWNWFIISITFLFTQRLFSSPSLLCPIYNVKNWLWIWCLWWLPQVI